MIVNIIIPSGINYSLQSCSKEPLKNFAHIFLQATMPVFTVILSRVILGETQSGAVSLCKSFIVMQTSIIINIVYFILSKYIWFKTPLNWGISKLATIQLPSPLFSHIS